MITFPELRRDLIPGFEILEPLGAGGQGLVVKAHQKSLDRSVAVKIVQPGGQLGDEQRQRFLREAKLIARLEHEGIVHVMDFGTVEDLAYLVMEHVRGKSLAKVVEERGPLPVPRALDYAIQVADVLAFLHKENLVHRDLKPSNVMLTERGRIKLLDFGLAKQLRKDPNVTQEGWGLGTPAYMAPEQVEDALHADIRADLYGLGATLFFLLTGRPPFVAAEGHSIFTQIFRDAPPDVRTLNPNVPVDLAGLLTRLLAKSPDSRPQRPADVLVHLRRVREAISSAPVGPTVPLRAVAARAPAGDAGTTRRRFLGWWLGAVPLAGGLVLAVSLVIGNLRTTSADRPADAVAYLPVEPPPATDPGETPVEPEPPEMRVMAAPPAAPVPPPHPARIVYGSPAEFRAGEWEIESRVPRLIEERTPGFILGGDAFSLRWRRAVQPLSAVGLAVVPMRPPGGIRPGAGPPPETSFVLQILADRGRVVAAARVAHRRVSFESETGVVEHAEREFSTPRGVVVDLVLVRDGETLRLRANGHDLLSARILRPLGEAPLSVRLQGAGLLEVRHLWVEGRPR